LYGAHNNRRSPPDLPSGIEGVWLNKKAVPLAQQDNVQPSVGYHPPPPLYHTSEARRCAEFRKTATNVLPHLKHPIVERYVSRFHRAMLQTNLNKVRKNLHNYTACHD
jgi:hypothetical protein